MWGARGAELRCGIGGAGWLPAATSFDGVVPSCEADLVHGNVNHPYLPSASVLKEWRFLYLSVSAYMCLIISLLQDKA